MRTTIPVAVAFIAGLAVVLATFSHSGTLVGGLKQEFIIWLTIVGGFTLLLGVVSIVRVNWSAISRQRPGWQYKVLTLLAVFAMAIPSVLPASWSPYFGTLGGGDLRLAVQLSSVTDDVNHVCYAGVLYRFCGLPGVQGTQR